MSVQGDKLSLGLAGNYSGAVEVGISADGQDLTVTDVANGTKTLSQVLANVAAHNIADHGNMTSDFATQYYNAARLTAYLADGANGNNIGVSADVGGSATLGAHVMNAAVHQRVPKFVLRVAKGGQQFLTIGAALAAVPTSGVDAPSPDRWWRVEVSPGVYDEAVLLDKQWVEIVGAGPESTRIVWNNSAAAGTWAVFVAVGNVALRGLGIESSNPTVAENVAVLVGAKSGSGSVAGVSFQTCNFYTPGEFAIWVSMNATKIVATGCDFKSAYGACVMAQGAVNLLNSAFESGVNGNSGFVAIQCANATGIVSVHSCRTSHILLRMINSTAKAVASLTNSTGSDDSSLYVNGFGNVASVVNWDGFGFNAEFTAAGPVVVTKLPEAGWYTEKSVELNWGPNETSSAIERRSFSGGHTGQPGNPVYGFFGGDFPDFHFYRRVVLSDATLTGDVFAIGDDSNTGGSANNANALALYLGNNNGAGKFLRWGRGDLSAFAELGFIGGDGAVNAPSFVGDGSALTGLAAAAHSHSGADITSGTVADGRLSSNVPLKNAANAFTGNGEFPKIGVGGPASSRLLTLTGVAPEMTAIDTDAGYAKQWHWGIYQNAFNFVETGVAVRFSLVSDGSSFYATGGGTHDFRHNGAQKFVVSSTGATVTGDFKATNYKSSDGSVGATATVTSYDPNAATYSNLVFKNGILVEVDGPY